MLAVRKEFWSRTNRKTRVVFIEMLRPSTAIVRWGEYATFTLSQEIIFVSRRILLDFFRRITLFKIKYLVRTTYRYFLDTGQS